MPHTRRSIVADRIPLGVVARGRELDSGSARVLWGNADPPTNAMLPLAEGASNSPGLVVFSGSFKTLILSTFSAHSIFCAFPSFFPFFHFRLGYKHGYRTRNVRDSNSPDAALLGFGQGRSMALGKLTVTDLKKTQTGFFSDGGNLSLQVRRGKNGDLTRSWIFRFKLSGKNERLARSSPSA